MDRKTNKDLEFLFELYKYNREELINTYLSLDEVDRKILKDYRNIKLEKKNITKLDNIFKDLDDTINNLI